MNKLKICVISQDLYTLGGVQRVITDVINYFKIKHCDEITIIMKYDYNDVQCFEINNSINIYNLSDVYSNRKGKYLKIIWALNRRSALLDNHMYNNFLFNCRFDKQKLQRFSDFINEKNFDWVIGAGDDYALLVAILSDYLNAKTAGWMHSTFKAYYETRGHASYGAKSLNQKYLKKLDKVFVLNKSDKKRFDEEFNINSNILYNPIGTSECVPIQEQSIQLLFVGRLNKRVKGLDYLMDIMQKVVAKIPKCKLVIVGSGAGEAYLQKEIEKRKLSENVSLVGFQKNVGYYYSQSKLLISTSRWEGFGMTIIEAMSYGVPCISFENDGPNDIIQSGENGVLVPKFDTEMFASKIIEYLNDSVKYQKISINAHKRSNDFSLDTMAKQLKEHLSN